MASFSLNIAAWTAKAKGRADLVFRKTCIDVSARVVRRSPVKTGRFRGNWQPTFGAPATGSLNVTDKGGAATLGKVKSVAMAGTAGMTFYLSNSVPYANRIEFGWSKQAPAGVVRLTIAEFQAAVNKSVAEAKAEMP